MKNKLKVFLLIGLFVAGVSIVSAMNKQDTKVVSLLGMESRTVSLYKTVNNGGMVSKIYKDSNKDQYIYDTDGKMVGYLKDRKITKDNNKVMSKSQVKNSLTNENLKAKVYQFAKSIVDTSKTSIDKYELTKIDYVESYNEINFVFTKTVDGYKVNDSITISTDLNGEIVSFVANRQGLFDHIKEINVDEKELDQYITKVVNSEYKCSDFEVFSRLVDYVDGKIVISNYVKLIYDDGMQDATIVYYEI